MKHFGADFAGPGRAASLGPAGSRPLQHLCLFRVVSVFTPFACFLSRNGSGTTWCLCHVSSFDFEWHKALCQVTGPLNGAGGCREAVATAKGNERLLGCSRCAERGPPPGCIVTGSPKVTPRACPLCRGTFNSDGVLPLTIKTDAGFLCLKREGGEAGARLPESQGSRRVTGSSVLSPFSFQTLEVTVGIRFRPLLFPCHLLCVCSLSLKERHHFS